MRFALMNTSFGPVTVASTAKGLAFVHFGRKVPQSGIFDEQANQVYIEQLKDYFRGKRDRFDFPLDLEGTPFQVAVWRELLKIPYGETRSYGEIAKKVGKPGAARAVGMASHENPIAVVVPCHRVIGRNGALTGYAGGLRLKRELLSLEQGPTLFT